MNYLTQQEVAVLLRCSVHTIARLRREAGLPWLPGRPVLIPEEEFQRWLNNRTIRAPTLARGLASGTTAISGSTSTGAGTGRSNGTTRSAAPKSTASTGSGTLRRRRLILRPSAPTAAPKPRR